MGAVRPRLLLPGWMLQLVAGHVEEQNDQPSSIVVPVYGWVQSGRLSCSRAASRAVAVACVEQVVVGPLCLWACRRNDVHVEEQNDQLSSIVVAVYGWVQSGRLSCGQGASRAVAVVVVVWFGVEPAAAIP